MSFSRRALLAGIACLGARGAAWAQPRAGGLRILTSFPPTFFEPFRRAFMSLHPEVAVEVVQRKTTSALSSTTEARLLGADIFWASAPDAFEVLNAAGRLAPTTPRPTGAPPLVAGFPVNDPGNAYLGFALSGYGLAYNPRYLAEHALPLPSAWSELADPIFAGHIGISSPSRSGTTHVVVEALLQSLGWTAGWALWSAIGGNLATVTARSFGVSAGVARGRFGLGVSIDFLGRPEDPVGNGMAFTLPQQQIFATASIAVLAGAPNRGAAELFIDFILSPGGQALLLRPEIGRLPVSPGVLRAEDAAARELLTSAKPDDRALFDASLSARRYDAVNIIFDEMITHRRADLAELWRRLHRVESAVRERRRSDVAALAQEARQALEAAPIEERAVNDVALLRKLSRVPRGVPVGEEQARFESEIRGALDARRRTAREKLARAQSLLGQEALPAWAAP